jgi:hypothetical protein
MEHIGFWGYHQCPPAFVPVTKPVPSQTGPGKNPGSKQKTERSENRGKFSKKRKFGRGSPPSDINQRPVRGYLKFLHFRVWLVGARRPPEEPSPSPSLALPGRDGCYLKALKENIGFLHRSVAAPPLNRKPPILLCNIAGRRNPHSLAYFFFVKIRSDLHVSRACCCAQAYGLSVLL